MMRLWENLKESEEMEMNPDYYNLTFYGYYINSDEEDLCRYPKMKKVRRLLEEQVEEDELSNWSDEQRAAEEGEDEIEENVIPSINQDEP